jgi:hypothetical protein
MWPRYGHDGLPCAVGGAALMIIVIRSAVADVGVMRMIFPILLC